jgi:hypothetical protein
MLGIEDRAKIKVFYFHNNLHIWFQVYHQKQGRLATRSQGCESSDKYNSIRLKGVQLQDAHLLKFRFLHHEDVALWSNLEMTSKVVIHLLV